MVPPEIAASEYVLMYSQPLKACDAIYALQDSS
jgi:hypothetical protein